MNQFQAENAVKRLRTMTVAEADRFLCASHTDDLHAIADMLRIRLPLRGGDKPCIIIGALGLKAVA